MMNLISALIAYLMMTKPKSNPKPNLRITTQPSNRMPVPHKISTKYSVGNEEFHDDFLWLRNSSHPHVQRYIQRENDWTDRWARQHSELIHDIARDLQNHSQIQLLTGGSSCFEMISSASAFWQDDKYLYGKSVKEELGELEVVLRRKASFTRDCACLEAEEEEELLLDFNRFFQGSPPEYWTLGIFEILPGSDYLAFSIDLEADEQYDLYIWNIIESKVEYGPILSTYYSARWYESADGYTHLFYNVVDEKWGVPLSIGSVGPFQSGLKNHSKKPKHDIIYTEVDPSLTVELDQSNDLNHLFIKVFYQTNPWWLD
jgi:protease II